MVECIVKRNVKRNYILRGPVELEVPFYGILRPIQKRKNFGPERVYYEHWG